MDGNGRWARERNLPRVAGHRKGLEVVRNLVPVFGNSGIKYLTLFAFSSENWKRPSAEVALLVDLMTSALERDVGELHENAVRLRVIGDHSRFPDRLQQAIREAESLTRQNNAMHLTIAFNYGGRWDMLKAFQGLLEKVRNGTFSISEVTPGLIEDHLCTRGLPDPDFFIRTGGEVRISNFLLWQLAYTELYFTETFWPDFDECCLEQALHSYASRQRRFGATEDQVLSAG